MNQCRKCSQNQALETLASRAVNDKRRGGPWRWLAGHLVANFRDFSHNLTRLNKGHSKNFCMFFCRQMKARSVRSLSRHELILPTLHPGWKLYCRNKRDTEPTQGQDILAWAQGHVDRSTELLFSSESGQRVSSSMGTDSAHLFDRNCTEGPYRSHSSLLLHCGEFKFEFSANGENCGRVGKLSMQLFFFSPFLNLEILSLTLNKFIIIL